MLTLIHSRGLTFIEGRLYEAFIQVADWTYHIGPRVIITLVGPRRQSALEVHQRVFQSCRN